MSIKKNVTPSLFDFVDQVPIMKRLMQVFGVSNTTDMAKATGKTYQTIRHYEKNERGTGRKITIRSVGIKGGEEDVVKKSFGTM